MQQNSLPKQGFTLGKFMPLHKGHIALVEFALQQCEELTVLLCASANEMIPGTVRKKWLEETFANDSRVKIELIEYDEKELPNTSVSSRPVSELWAAFIRKSYPGINIFFSSEPYGEYIAEFLNIEHKHFDVSRQSVPISASAILRDPFGNWDFIAPAARSWFVKKICISGSESTGKSTLAELLARHYNTSFVPEMARNIIEKTEDVQFEELTEIARLHATAINEKIKQARKILICDTDLNITKSYAKYLFDKELKVDEWIEDANRFDLHIFLDTDCDFVQDGTRLSQTERDKLSNYHRQQLDKAGIDYVVVGGNWHERFEQAKAIIDEHFFFASL